MVDATNSPWWFTVIGVKPVRTLVIAFSGTMIDDEVATEEAAEVADEPPPLASELIDSACSAAVAASALDVAVVVALPSVTLLVALVLVPALVRVPLVIVLVLAVPATVTGELLT